MLRSDLWHLESCLQFPKLYKLKIQFWHFLHICIAQNPKAVSMMRYLLIRHVEERARLEVWFHSNVLFNIRWHARNPSLNRIIRQRHLLNFFALASPKTSSTKSLRRMSEKAFIRWREPFLLGNLQRQFEGRLHAWNIVLVNVCIGIEFLLFQRHFFYLEKKTSLSLYVLAASDLNGASALMVSFLSTLRHNTHCGLTLPCPTLM